MVRGNSRGRGSSRGFKKAFQPLGGRGRGRDNRGRGETVSTTSDSWSSGHRASYSGRSSIGLEDDRTRDRDSDIDQNREKERSRLTSDERAKLGLRVTVQNSGDRRLQQHGEEKADLRDEFEKQSDLVYGGTPETTDRSASGRYEESRSQHFQQRREQGVRLITVPDPEGVFAGGGGSCRPSTLKGSPKTNPKRSGFRYTTA